MLVIGLGGSRHLQYVAMLEWYMHGVCGTFQSNIESPCRAQRQRQYVWAVSKYVFVVRVPPQLGLVQEEIDVYSVVVVVVFVVNV